MTKPTPPPLGDMLTFRQVLERLAQVLPDARVSDSDDDWRPADLAAFLARSSQAQGLDAPARLHLDAERGLGRLEVMGEGGGWLGVGFTPPPTCVACGTSHVMPTGDVRPCAAAEAVVHGG